MPDIDVHSMKDEVLAAVKQNGLALEYASDTLKNHRQIVLAAVRQHGSALYHASETLKNNHQIVLAAVTQNGWMLEHASEKLKNDRQIVLAAVTQNGRALGHASDTLKKDRNFVLAAVTQNFWVLEYASGKLKNNRQIVLAAVRQHGSALYHVSEKLKNDRQIVLAAVTQNGSALYHASDTLQNDSILKRLVHLNSSDAAGQFRALEPLKTKLKQETNTERQTAAEKMIDEIEDAILCSHERTYFDFKEAFNQAVNKAKPVLEQQTGWKKVIDAVANTILSLFCALRREQNRGGEQNRFSFFTNPNPVQEEIKQVQEVIVHK